MPQTILANRMPEDTQYLNPKQEGFLKNYLDPLSDTFSNITQSALKAGYAAEYADKLMARMPSWLADNLGDARRLRQAEDNLDSLLKQDTDIKVKADMTKFALSTMGRRKYSTRTETDLTSKGEQINQINYIMPADSKIISSDHITDAEVKPNQEPINKPDEIIPKDANNTEANA
jgi:hypothetical protein